MYGAFWTDELVAARLVAVFKRLPGVPVYSPRAGSMHRNIFDPVPPIDGVDLIAAVHESLGYESKDAYRLLRWARTRASESSIREFCAANGLNRSTYYGQKNRALKKVAVWLNGRAEARLLCGPRVSHGRPSTEGKSDDSV